MRGGPAIFALTLAGAVVWGCGGSGSKADGPGGHGAGGTAGGDGGGGRDGSAPDRPATNDGRGGESQLDGAGDIAPTHDADGSHDADAVGSHDADVLCNVTIDGGPAVACTTAIVSASYQDHYCGLKAGRVNCWGATSQKAYLVTPNAPVLATVASNLVQIAMADMPSYPASLNICGVDGQGRGTCWSETGAKDMGGGLAAVLISLSGGTCSLASDGSVDCPGQQASDLPPVGPRYVKMVAGQIQFVFLDDTGTPYYRDKVFPAGIYLDIASNYGERFGAVRNDGAAVSLSPLGGTVVESGSFTTMALDGGGRACGIDRDGEISCWVVDSTTAPAAITDIPSGPFVQIVGGRTTFCGLKRSGTTTCWGDEEVDVPAGW